MASQKSYSLSALVIKRKNIGDGDKVLTVFTRQKGKVRLLAKGIRKVGSRRAPHLELFSHVDLFVHKGRTWDLITDATATSIYETKLPTLAHVSVAYCMAEVIDAMLPDNEAHEEVFTLFIASMNELIKTPEEDTLLRLAQFLREFLILTGYERSQSQVKGVSEYVHQIELLIERKIKTVKLLSYLKEK